MTEFWERETNSVLKGRGVIAIRIYFQEGSPGRMPMADLVLNDHTVHTIEWANVEDRKQYMPGINGYTLIYDERPKMSWEEMSHR